ncbi:MAG: hypothetical protein OXL97_02915 [Chloroflexota bacterium]|nr:hypothetical protein [Chloroflexota bacterium]MDE2885837.1 hypothetical protein [Chloroflexota bacterium]
MVTYDEFSAFKTENTAQHTELRERLERLTTEVGGLTTQVAVLSERIDERTKGLSDRIGALQRTQDLTNRLMIAILGTMGATFAGVVYAVLSRSA